MNIIQNLCLNSPCYKDGRYIKPKGIIIHSVGTPQPDASVFQRIWNRPDARACVHAVLEASGRVIQCLPWTKRGWHAGLGTSGVSANNTHIGVEMTEPNTIKYTGGSSWIDLNPEKTKAFVLDSYKTAVELFAFLCLENGWNPLENGVIISHAEGFKRGIASNHGDPEHIWRVFGLTLDQFRKDIHAKMNPVKVPEIIEVKKPVLKVDGYLGEKTITAMQKYFGTLEDGIISRPSMMVKKLQELLEIRKDGYMGDKTIKALQKRMGTPQDGIISEPSMMVKELQRRLNKGKI